ncbi:MAG: KH domain-containing protein [Actinobacteria bacterium]|nr:KH domain-containing protein [Actinomycetota bacterium]
MKEVLEHIARALVDNPDAVEVTETDGDRGTTFQLRVDPEDMGKVIGRGGRTAKAIRAVMKAAAIKSDARIRVEIVD